MLVKFPEQIVAVAAVGILSVGSAFTVTVLVKVVVHPLPLVTA